MRLRYLGTAAAEGIPAVFCRCPVCAEARRLGGRDLRTRSQAIVNDDLLIDLPPDTYAHYLAYGFDLPGITELLVTHSHTDHFYATELEMRCSPLAHPEPPVMRIYCNEAVEAKFHRSMPPKHNVEKNFSIVRARPFVPLAIRDYSVVPLLARHDRAEECLLYLISSGGKTLLYGNDTGLFPDSTFDYIERSGARIDLASFDCTAMGQRDGKNHMGLADVAEARERLTRLGALGAGAACVITHFSHNGRLTRPQLEEAAAKEGFLVAYDGLSLEL